jgi:hypothetical protein
MATSDLLRITLIANGAEAGTWGDTTNINLGTVLEDSIAGYAAVSVISASQAFTIVDGAYDQSRLAMLRLTTTTGANFAVYAPPVSKQYVIQNGSAYTATIYNSTVAGNTTAAGAGVAIPAGKTMTVWSNATDFLVQNNHVIGTVVGNVTGDLTGNVTGNVTGNTNGVVTATAGSTAVTATFGDNDTSIATTAFVQAALQAIYPIGSMYINASDGTNPGTLFGFGTWAAYATGRVLVSYEAGDPLFGTVAFTGGSRDTIVVTHNHTATSTVSDPGHSHTINTINTGGGLAGANTRDTVGQSTQSTNSVPTGITVSTSISNTGSSGVNANLQPYTVVYMWKRTA